MKEKPTKSFDILKELRDPDNRAFVRALREGIFAMLSSLDLQIWGRLTTEEKSRALLPWRDGKNVTGEDIEYFRKIIHAGKTRY